MKWFGINRNHNTHNQSGARRVSSSRSSLLFKYYGNSSSGWNSTSDLTGISVLDARKSGKRNGSSNNKSLRFAPSRRDEIRSHSSQSRAYPFDEESRQDHISTTSIPHTPGVRIVTEEINGSLNVEQLGDCDVTTLSNAEFKKIILEDNLGNLKNPPTTPETNDESDDGDAKNTSFYSEDMIDDLIEDTRSVDIERRNRWKGGIVTSWRKEKEEKLKKKNKPPSSYFAFPRHGIMKLRKVLFENNNSMKQRGVPKAKDDDLVFDGNNSIASAPEPRQQQQRHQHEQKQASKENQLPKSHVSFQQQSHATKQAKLPQGKGDDDDQLSAASTSKLMKEYCFDRSSTDAVTLPKHDEVEACMSGMFEEMTDPDRIKEDFGIVFALLQADSQACLGCLTDPVEIATNLNGGGIVHAANSCTKNMAADSQQHISMMENRNDVATTTTSLAKDDAPLSQVASQPHHHQQQRE